MTRGVSVGFRQLLWNGNLEKPVGHPGFFYVLRLKSQGPPEGEDCTLPLGLRMIIGV